MGFNAERFERAQFEHRRRLVPVQTLAAYFDDLPSTEVDGKAVVGVPMWEVRGLSGNELHRAAEAANRQEIMVSLVKAMTTNADKVAAVRQTLGLGPDTPGEMAKRIEMLVMGSVQPSIEMPIAVILAEKFPVEFLTLTQAITELTGQGADLAKPAAASHTTTA